MSIIMNPTLTIAKMFGHRIRTVWGAVYSFENTDAEVASQCHPKFANCLRSISLTSL